MPRFSRQQRLLKADEFSSVFNLRCSVRGDRLQVLARPNGLTHARLGMVVGKKVARRAVARNYMKRFIRETFRLHDGDVNGLDVIVWPRLAFGREEAAAVREELLSLFRRLAKKCRASSSS